MHSNDLREKRIFMSSCFTSFSTRTNIPKTCYKKKKVFQEGGCKRGHRHIHRYKQREGGLPVLRMIC